MERLHQPYESVMAMPCGRRKRYCEELGALDEWRAQRAKSRTKSRRK